MNMLDFTKTIVRVFETQENEVSVYDPERTFTIFIPQAKIKEMRIVPGSYLHVQRDYLGNVVAVAPFPRDENFLKCEEENPKRDTDSQYDEDIS